MTFYIIFYEIFWDAKQEHGGVDLALENGSIKRLTTTDPDVLHLWTILLDAQTMRYYSDEGSEGLCSEAGMNRITDSPAHHRTDIIG